MQGLAPEHVRYVREVERVPGQGRQSVNGGREVVRAAHEMLLARDAERPFFLFLHFFDAHTDFTPRRQYRRRFVAPYDGPIDGTTAQLMALRRGS
jgi:hypothetical protein